MEKKCKMLRYSDWLPKSRLKWAQKVIKEPTFEFYKKVYPLNAMKIMGCKINSLVWFEIYIQYNAFKKGWNEGTLDKKMLSKMVSEKLGGKGEKMSLTEKDCYICCYSELLYNEEPCKICRHFDQWMEKE